MRGIPGVSLVVKGFSPLDQTLEEGYTTASDGVLVERRVVVDLSRLLRGDGPDVLGARRLMVGAGRIKEIHERLGQQAGLWPQLNPPADAGVALELAAALHSRADELVVLGTPGAVRSARMAVHALAPDAPIWWVTTPPQPDLLERLLARPATWLLLEGPGWADACVIAAAAAGRPVAIAGTGEEDQPPDGWWFSDPLAGDGRFGWLGAGAQLIRAWAGIDVAAWNDGLSAMQRQFERVALYENPAYSFGIALSLCIRDLQRDTLVWITDDGRLELFVDWIGRIWGALLADVRGDYARADAWGGMRLPVGVTSLSGLAGDQELHEQILSTPRGAVAVLWGGGGEAGLLPAFQDMWERAAQPAVRVRLTTVDAAALASAAILGLHAGVCSAFFLERDPLAMRSQSAWEGALRRVHAE